MCRNLSANCANFKEQSAFRKISYALKLCILSYPWSFRLSSFLIPCLPCLSGSCHGFLWAILNLQVCATICVKFLENCSCVQWYALSSSELFPLRFHERLSDLFICWVELHGVIEHILKRSVWSSQADFHLLQDLLDQNLIFQARDKVTPLKLCDPWTCMRIAFLCTVPGVPICPASILVSIRQISRAFALPRSLAAPSMNSINLRLQKYFGFQNVSNSQRYKLRWSHRVPRNHPILWWHALPSKICLLRKTTGCEMRRCRTVKLTI